MTFWADKIALEIIKQKGKEQNIATGITPSGPIHIGNIKEVITAFAILKELEDQKAKPKLIYIADDFDPLRRLYPFLPKKFAQHVGKPLFLIPDPFECCENYAQHFLKPFFESLSELKIKPQIFYASEMYEEGLYTPYIKEVLSNINRIKKIIEEVSGRKVKEDWIPYNPLCKKCNKITDTKVTNINLNKSYVQYECDCGYSGKADLKKAEGKLPWRIDWPARWKILKITAEPFGKDHAAPGGSYDTGQKISKEIFSFSPPFPVFYEWIYLKGKGAMSSSRGVFFEANDFFSILPPEILKYLILKVRPEKHITFDPSEGLANLVDEFAELEEKYYKKKEKSKRSKIYQLSQIQIKKRVLPPVSFRHLVNATQAANGKFDEMCRILERTGHKKATKDKNLLKKQTRRIENWLKNYAPDNLKFQVSKNLPEQVKDLNKKQKEFLKKLAESFKKQKWEAEKLHNKIYEILKDLNLEPSLAFSAIYISLLGQESGPKAGWFLTVLDKDFVVERFKRAAK